MQAMSPSALPSTQGWGGKSNEKSVNQQEMQSIKEQSTHLMQDLIFVQI